MSSGFDPYREWLNLNVVTGPPDHYQLLGVQRFESDTARIAEAADRALSRVRSHRPGLQSQAWAQLLDRIVAAKTCLTDDALRAAYDRTLDQPLLAEARPVNPAAEAHPDVSGLTSTSNANPMSNPPTASGPAAASPTRITPKPTQPYANPGIPTPQDTVTPSEIPATPGQAVGVVDPMAPLDPAAMPSNLHAAPPGSPAAEAPIPGFNHVAPQLDPMAPIESVVNAAHPIMDQIQPHAATVEPVMARPAGGFQSPIQSTPASPQDPQAPFLAVEAETPPELGVQPTVAALAQSRSRQGLLTPILVGMAVGLFLLMMGGLYLYMSGSNERDVTAQVFPTSEPQATSLASTPASTPTEPTLPEPTIPEPTIPEPTIPEPTIPEPTIPEPTLPESPAFEMPTLDPTSTDSALLDMTPSDPMPTIEPPANPSPANPSRPEPSRADLIELSTKLKTARAALAQHDFSTALAQLENAQSLTMSETHAKKFEGLRQVAQFASEFREAIVAATSKLQAGETLRIKSSMVGIVETSADFLIVRVAGMNRRYELSKLPLGLAVALAHQVLSPTDPQTIVRKASYVLTNPESTATTKAKAGEWFVEASAGLPEAADLASVMEDDYDFVAGVIAPTAMPSTTSTDPSAKPTREEVTKLAAALVAARAAIAARDMNSAETQFAQAAGFAKLPDHKQLLWRLQRLAEHVLAFDEAMREAVADLKPGDVIKVGKSTELIVERVNVASLAVEVVGLKKTYPLNNPPLGLAVALVQTKLSPDDPVTKAIQAAFVVVSKNSNDRSIEKARTWYEESAAGNPEYAELGKVIDDDYNLLSNFQE